MDYLKRIVWCLILSAAVAAGERAHAEPETVAGSSPERIELFPPSIELTGPRQQTSLVVTGHYADGTVRDVTRTARFTSGDSQVAAVQDNTVIPQSDGSTRIVVTAGGQTATVAVVVKDHAEPEPVSFRYETLAALSKQGCNSGACHGSPSGKGGFRLSLRAFDPKLDEQTLIREAMGRRINSFEPEHSLLLQKPLMSVPHGGGKRLGKDDPAFALLRDWIAEGCRLGAEDEAKCVRLEVYPPSGRVLKRPAADTQQLSVLAHFADGTVRDVTRLAVFSSSDGQIATVNADGLIVGHDRGESAIVVRYLEFIETTFITFVQDVEGFAWSDPPANNYVDELVNDKLKQLRFLPSGVCSDEVFVRRVYLDVLGILPTIVESQAFLKDKSPNKRETLIQQLLERPEFARFWAMKWGDLLRLTSAQVGASSVHKYHRWVQRAFQNNVPYDEFARQLLAGKGSTLTNPAANFYRTTKDMNDCVETVSQIFMGSRLQCAKCHNHPFERWTQDNYYGMGAFFNRVQRTKMRRGDEMFISVSAAGEVTQPRTGQQMKPWLPLSGEVDSPGEADRRDLFVDWLVRPDNPFFAKVEANRIWSQLLGRGIVEPADDFRDSNPPSNAALLDALAKDFAQHQFDRKQLIRTILNSRTYQSSSQTNPFNADDTRYFSHYEPRLLSAEQLLDAISHTTGVSQSFGSLPAGTKATQLPSPDLAKNDFLKIFGQPERSTACACERSTDSNLSQALQLYNGPLVHGKLTDSSNRFRRLLAGKPTDDEIITHMFQTALCRSPNAGELAALRRHVEVRDSERDEANVAVDREMAALQQQIADLRASFRKKLVDAKFAEVAEPIRADLKAALAVAADQRSEVQKYLAEKLGPATEVKPDEITAALDEAAKKSIADAEQTLAELSKRKRTPESDRIAAMEDITWALLNMNEFLFQH